MQNEPKRPFPQQDQPTDELLKRTGQGWYLRGSRPGHQLPHMDDPDKIQFVTYRLIDSLPSPVLRQIEAELALVSVTAEEAELERYGMLELALDRGFGDCWLRRKACAQCVWDCLLERDGADYELHAFTIMPNHVHVLARFEKASMGEAVEQWKVVSADKANRVLRRSGPFWQDEYWDRYIRDVNHYETTMRYIAMNAVKANLVKSPANWKWSYRATGLRFR